MLGIYTYSYNDSGAWKDQLTGYSFQDYYKNDSFSGTITYDVMGNPLTYFNGKKNWNFIWKYGRQLASATDGTHTITNTYDVDGVRENKTVDGVEHKYVTLDGKIIRETYGTVTVDYFYDNEGRPYKLVVDEDNSTSGGSYTGYFVLNQQGDVIAILNANGVKVVSYEYNAWGQIKEETATSTNVGTLFLEHNALKYRGYYYDADLGLYYLNNRYYDPVIGRFINADDVDTLTAEHQNFMQYNLYAYCLNNPVNRIDESGYLSISILAKGASFVATGLAAIGVAAAVVTCGVATPVMLGVAAITMGAGALTTINGASDIGEAISGHNVVRDTVFKGNAKAYNTYSAITTTVSAVGSIACGGWLTANKPRISAYNNIQDYNYTNTISDANHMNRPYNNSVLMQKQIIKYGKMKKDSGGFGYIFTASGAVNGKTNMWRLGINVAKRLVWHFGHGF